MIGNKTALVISAHAADFVWRCGGAIALHQELGFNLVRQTGIQLHNTWHKNDPGAFS